MTKSNIKYLIYSLVIAIVIGIFIFGGVKYYYMNEERVAALEKLKIKESEEKAATLEEHKLAKSAIDSLRRLNDKISVGINFIEFRQELGNVLFEVKSYLESDAAKNNKEFSLLLVNILNHYENSLKYWQYKLGRRYGNRIEYESDMGNFIREYYPEYKVEYGEPYWSETAVKVMWARASKDIEMAKNLLSK